MEDKRMEILNARIAERDELMKRRDSYKNTHTGLWKDDELDWLDWIENRISDLQYDIEWMGMEISGDV